MAFQASKREVGELYCFFRLLVDGKLHVGKSDGTGRNLAKPIAYVQRVEGETTRRYYIEPYTIHIDEGDYRSEDNHFSEYLDNMNLDIPRDDFAEAICILIRLLDKPGEEVEIPDELENFLDVLKIYELEAQTEDRTDLHIAFWHKDVPPVGFTIRCSLCPMNPLLDGGRTANFKFEQSGVKFASPTVSKINSSPEGNDEVLQRMLLIERLGGVLKYSDVADKVFRSNLQMIDLHFPRLLAEMVRTMHQEGIVRISELTARMEEINPLKIKEELITKHCYYKHKVKQFLLTLLFGMRPAKIYNGADSAIEGLLFVDKEGMVLGYTKQEIETLKDFLFNQTRLLKGSLEKDKYGYLEKENGTYYFKLNAKIGWNKRNKTNDK